MRDNKHLTNDPDQFIRGLRCQERIKFENEVLKADICRLESKNSRRETMIKYYRKINNEWKSFAFFCSKSIKDVIDDFKSELKIA